MNSPPQIVPSSPYPVPSQATPRTSSAACRCSSRQASTWARWCCTATRGRPSCLRVARGGVVGVAVAGDGGEIGAVQLGEHVDRAPKHRARRRSAEVADVRAEDHAGRRPRPPRCSSSARRRRARSRRALPGSLSGEGAWPRARRSRIGPAAARRTTESSTGWAIGRSCSRKASAMPVRPPVRVVLGEAQRLLGQIRARGHGRPAEGAQEQDLQGRVGEQGADPRVAGRDARRASAASGRRRSRTIGAAGEVSSASARGREARRRRGPPPGRETSPRRAFRRAACAGAGPPRPSRRRHRPSGGSRRFPSPRGFRRRRAARRRALIAASPRTCSPVPRVEDGGGPAVGAGVRLGVEAPVVGIVVFGLAARAHPERAHRRVGPVIGQALQDRIPGTALGAVDEGVAMAPVLRIAQLPPAIRAQRQVGRQRGRGGEAVGGAGSDREIAGRPAGRPDPPRPARRTRRARPAAHRPRIARTSAAIAGGGAGRPDQHSLRVVAHPAAQAQAGGGPPDKGTEADALDRAAHPQQDVDLPVAGRRRRRGLADGACGAAFIGRSASSAAGSSPRSRSYHSAMPSPLREDRASTRACGAIRRMFSSAAARSKPRRSSQVDLRQQDDVGRLEDRGVLERLVLALGRRKQDDAEGFAQDRTRRGRPGCRRSR